MTALALQPEYIRDKTYTVEEYFELEKHSEIRHEFVNGKLIAMPGESVIANRIADNCGFNLRLHLNKKGYDTIRHDVRTMIRNGKLYRYPDVSVAKRSEITQTHAVTKPEMLIEVTTARERYSAHYTVRMNLQDGRPVSTLPNLATPRQRQQPLKIAQEEPVRPAKTAALELAASTLTERCSWAFCSLER